MVRICRVIEHGDSAPAGKADNDGLLRLRDNFGGRSPNWFGSAMPKLGQNFEKQMRQGETVEAAMETPTDLPLKPLDAYVAITSEVRK